MGILDAPTYTRAEVDEIADNANAEALTVSRLRQAGPPTRANVKSLVSSGYTGHPISVVGSGVTASNVNDTTDFIRGTQSARLTRDSTGNNAIFAKDTGLTINATGCDVSIEMKYDDFTKADKLSVFLYSGGALTDSISAVNVVDLSSYGLTSVYTQPGDWVTLHIPWSRFTSSSGAGITRTAITGARVYVTSKSGQSSVWHLNSVGFPYQDELDRWPNGVLTVTMDDCWTGQSDLAIPYLDRTGDLATLFPIKDYVNANAFPQATLLRLRDLGHEIGAHASSLAVHNAGILAMTDDELRIEAETLRQWQVDNQFQSTSYAWPLGQWDVGAAAIIGKYYPTGRLAEAAGDMPETARPANPMRLRCYDLASFTDTVLKARMDRAKTDRGHMIMLVHQVVASAPSAGQTDMTKFQSVIDYAHTIGMPIRTLGEVRSAAAA